jgi:hypothetical protein
MEARICIELNVDHAQRIFLAKEVEESCHLLILLMRPIESASQGNFNYLVHVWPRVMTNKVMAIVPTQADSPDLAFDFGPDILAL